MRELAALVGRYVRCAVRGRGALYVLGGGVLALAAVLLLVPGGEGVGSTVLIGGLAVVGVIAFGTAAWAGGLLPRDRAEGRAVWLATTAPSAASRRAAAAGAGLLLAPAVALLGALLLGLLLPLLVDDTGVRASTDLGLARTRVPRGPADASRLRVVLPAAAGDARTLEVDLRVLYIDDSKAGSPLDLAYAVEGPSGPLPGWSRQAFVAGTGPVRVDLPAEASVVRLAAVQGHAVLVLRAGRVLGVRQSFLVTLLLAGLVLGIAAAAMAPVAVAISRWTSAPTATTAAFVLAVVGGFRFLLADLAVPGAGWLHETGLTVVDVATRVAPDLHGLGLLSEPAAGRALQVADLAGLLPLALYALVGLLLVVVPIRNEPALGETS